MATAREPEDPNEDELTEKADQENKTELKNQEEKEEEAVEKEEEEAGKPQSSIDDDDDDDDDDDAKKSDEIERKKSKKRKKEKEIVDSAEESCSPKKKKKKKKRKDKNKELEEKDRESVKVQSEKLIPVLARLAIELGDNTEEQGSNSVSSKFRIVSAPARTEYKSLIFRFQIINFLLLSIFRLERLVKSQKRKTIILTRRQKPLM